MAIRRKRRRTAATDSRVLALPVLVSVWHREREIRERLQGLNYEMADGGLSPHPLAADWVRQQAEQCCSLTALHTGQRAARAGGL